MIYLPKSKVKDTRLALKPSFVVGLGNEPIACVKAIFSGICGWIKVFVGYPLKSSAF